MVDDKLVSTKVVKDGMRMMTLGSSIVSRKIFDTTYSGLIQFEEDYSIITRVDESFVGFRLDAPDTNKENVTIEGK